MYVVNYYSKSDGKIDDEYFLYSSFVVPADFLNYIWLFVFKKILV
jgi:hypothetical protein